MLKFVSELLTSARSEFAVLIIIRPMSAPLPLPRKKKKIKYSHLNMCSASSLILAHPLVPQSMHSESLTAMLKLWFPKFSNTQIMLTHECAIWELLQ